MSAGRLRATIQPGVHQQQPSDMWGISGLNVYGNFNIINHVSNGAIVNDFGFDNKIAGKGSVKGLCLITPRE